MRRRRRADGARGLAGHAQPGGARPRADARRRAGGPGAADRTVRTAHPLAAGRSAAEGTGRHRRADGREHRR